MPRDREPASSCNAHASARPRAVWLVSNKLSRALSRRGRDAEWHLASLVSSRIVFRKANDAQGVWCLFGTSSAV